jgi:very-short-patch-repair endonuclease
MNRTDPPALLAPPYGAPRYPYRALKPSFLSWIATGRVFRVPVHCTPQTPAGGFESEPERRLAAALRRAGVAVHPQQTVTNRFRPGFEYRADLAYYDQGRELKVDIEVDGAFKADDPARQRRMARRDDWFRSHGWHVLRFRAGDCYTHPDRCARFVKEYVASLGVQTLGAVVMRL